MNSFDYTVVLGLDARHLKQLSWVWPTWMRHKPTLKDHPLLVFYDADQVNPHDIKDVVSHSRLDLIPWPLDGATYSGNPDSGDKWDNPQRHKMLAGFVHVPACYVETPYWLKLDTDVVATGQKNWIDLNWFVGSPSIVAHKWTIMSTAIPRVCGMPKTKFRSCKYKPIAKKRAILILP